MSTWPLALFKQGGPPDVSALRSDEIRLGGLVYMTRHYLSPELRFHHILRSDPDRDMHDHPWDFVSVILTGAYEETTPTGCKVYQAGSVTARRAEDPHRLTLIDGEPVWTFVATGKVRRKWGFHTQAGWVQWDRYERDNPSQLVDAMPKGGGALT